MIELIAALCVGLIFTLIYLGVVLFSRAHWLKMYTRETALSTQWQSAYEQSAIELHELQHNPKVIVHANAWPIIRKETQMGLDSFNNDPADDEYANGYKAALEETMRFINEHVQDS